MTKPALKIYQVGYHHTLKEFAEDKSLAEVGEILGYGRATIYQMLQKQGDEYLVKISGNKKDRKYEIIQIKNKGQK